MTITRNINCIIYNINISVVIICIQTAYSALSYLSSSFNVQNIVTYYSLSVTVVTRNTPPGCISNASPNSNSIIRNNFISFSYIILCIKRSTISSMETTHYIDMIIFYNSTSRYTTTNSAISGAIIHHNNFITRYQYIFALTKSSPNRNLVLFGVNSLIRYCIIFSISICTTSTINI